MNIRSSDKLLSTPMKNQPTAIKFELDADFEQEAEALVGPPGQWRARRDLQLSFLSQFGLAKKDRFLDLGCGSLRLGLPLIDYLNVCNYTGVDIDPDCISVSRRLISLFDLHHKSPRIFLSRTFGLEELEQKPCFDIIWIFQVLIHLTNSHVEQAMRSISVFLADGGSAYGSAKIDDSLETISRKGDWRQYAYVHAPLSYYKKVCSKMGLQIQEIGAFNSDGWIDPTHPERLSMLKISKKISD